MRHYPIVVLGVCAALLSACEKKAEGQVAAVVNGEEITLGEINAELGLEQAPEGAEASAVRQAALQRIVQRRLVAQAAREEGLDKSPEYLIRQRALDDALLVQLLAKKVGSTIKVPAPAEIEAYIAARPEQFANRSILTIDRLQFPSTDTPAVKSGLAAAKSLEAIEALLRANEVRFARGTSEIDTARIEPVVTRQLLALPAGEPFILPQGPATVAGMVVNRRSAPITGDEARPIAVNAIRNEQLGKAVERRLTAARNQAEIEYQTGYAPPKGSASGKAGT